MPNVVQGNDYKDSLCLGSLRILEPASDDSVGKPLSAWSRRHG